MKKYLFLSYLLFVLVGMTSLVSCSDDDENINDWTNNQETSKVNNNGHAYVDLGLSAYWATCNIGAYSSTSQGNKYAFGETAIKSSYTSSNYVGGSTDVAKLDWGGDWRLPTKSELEEIVSKCSWKISTKNNIQVVTVTGPNGNSIDLPYYSYIQDEGLAGWYWSSTSYSSSKAYCLYFAGSSVSYGTNNKYNGFLVRPVMTNANYNGSNGNTGGSDNDNTGGGTTTYEKPDIGFYDFTATKTSLTVQYRIFNKEEAEVTSAKIYYGTSSNPSSSKTATVSGTLITANISGLKAGTTYYVKCKATGKGGTTTTTTTKCVTNY